MNDEPTITVESLVNVLRQHGCNASAPDIIQSLMESEDTYSVNDGDNIKVYQQGTNDLLMTLENRGSSNEQDNEHKQ